MADADGRRPIAAAQPASPHPHLGAQRRVRQLDKFFGQKAVRVINAVKTPCRERKKRCRKYSNAFLQIHHTLR
jgi:hypothetical protein